MAKGDWARNRKGETEEEAVNRAHETIKQAAAEGNETADEMYRNILKDQDK